MQFEIPFEENICFLLSFIFKVGTPSLSSDLAGYFNNEGLYLKVFLLTL